QHGEQQSLAQSRQSLAQSWAWSTSQSYHGVVTRVLRSGGTGFSTDSNDSNRWPSVSRRSSLLHLELAPGIVWWKVPVGELGGQAFRTGAYLFAPRNDPNGWIRASGCR